MGTTIVNEQLPSAVVISNCFFFSLLKISVKFSILRVLTTLKAETNGFKDVALPCLTIAPYNPKMGLRYIKY